MKMLSLLEEVIPCVDDLERCLAIYAVSESRERIFSGCPDSSHTVLAGHPNLAELPNKSSLIDGHNLSSFTHRLETIGFLNAWMPMAA